MSEVRDKARSVRWNGVARLKRENRHGYTQAELYRENISGAKMRGTEDRLGRVSVGLRPTERYVNGEWVKV